MRRWVLAFLPSLALVLAASAIGAQVGGSDVVDAPVDRVLVVSFPGVSWSEVQARDLPNLKAFVAESAIGDLSTRIGRNRASTTDAYLSIGAGTRSVAPDVDVAVALDPDETYAGVRTADILERRLGRVPNGLAYLAVGAAIDRNETSSFGGQPGLLGDRLDEAGIRRAVIANADAAEGFVSDEPPPDGAYARGAATALMGSDGIVPLGTVGRGLLVDDPAAPFGRRLNPDQVLSAFDEVWTDERSVVLVEASDISRASAYAPRATPAQGRALRQQALTWSDELLGELLERVDPERDAVLVISPVSRGSSPELAMVALRTPDVDGGVLRSATTRRDGYVQLADVAPTILKMLGEEEPDEIEGRSFQVADRPAGGRIAELADEAAAAGFRDSLMPKVVTAVIGGLAVLALLAWRIHPRSARAEQGLRVGSYFALGVVPGTFSAAQVGAATDNLPRYSVLVAGVAIAYAGLCALVERSRAGLGAIAAVGLIVAMFAVDVVIGAPLQVNAVFGYSVAVAGRFAGLGNLAFALFGAATIVLAALVVERCGRRAMPAVVGLFTAVILLEGLPMLGADVGGVISMVPAFGLSVMLLNGHRPQLRDLGLLAGAAAVMVLAFAFVDSARPAGEQTHLARLAEHLVNGRLSSFTDSLSRRLQASFGGADLAARALIITLILGVATYVVLTARGVLGRRRIAWDLAHRSPVGAAAAGLAVLAAVGLVANDSSIAVPATMLIVVAPTAVLLHLAGRWEGVRS